MAIWDHQGGFLHGWWFDITHKKFFVSMSIILTEYIMCLTAFNTSCLDNYLWSLWERGHTVHVLVMTKVQVFSQSLYALIKQAVCTTLGVTSFLSPILG